jgi:hypothetical protein
VVWRADLSDPALFILPEPLIEVGCPCLALLIFCGGAAEDGQDSAHTEGDDSNAQMPAHITESLLMTLILLSLRQQPLLP